MCVSQKVAFAETSITSCRLPSVWTWALCLGEVTESAFDHVPRDNSCRSISSYISRSSCCPKSLRIDRNAFHITSAMDANVTFTSEPWYRMAAHTSGIEVTQFISLDRSYTSPSSTWHWDAGRFISSPWSPFPLDRPQCREDKTVYHTPTGNAS